MISRIVSGAALLLLKFKFSIRIPNRRICIKSFISQSSIDRDCRSIHEFILDEKEGCLCDLLHRTDSSHAGSVNRLLPHLLRHAYRRVSLSSLENVRALINRQPLRTGNHVRLDEARRDGITPHPSRSQLLRQGLCEADEARLARGIDRRSRSTSVGQGGGDVDDHPSRLQHGLARLPRSVDGAGQVDGDYFIDGPDGRPRQETIVRHACDSIRQIPVPTRKSPFLFRSRPTVSLFVSLE